MGYATLIDGLPAPTPEDFRERFRHNTDGTLGINAEVFVNKGDCPRGRDACEAKRGGEWDMCPYFMGSRSNAPFVGDPMRFCCAMKLT